MKFENIIVDEAKKILRITTADERWYLIGEQYIPSVTWICEHYPKGIGFYKWLAQHGWDEAQAIKEARGDEGSVVHQAMVSLLNGNEIHYNSVFSIPDTKLAREITVEEYASVMSFVAWINDTQPKIIAFDEIIVSSDRSYAGTLDLRIKIKNQPWLIDIKTSQYIWPSHELQVSAYKHGGNFLDHKTAILQLGYKANKKKFKFTEIEDKFELFQATQRIWAEECSKVQPLQREFPLTLKL